MEHQEACKWRALDNGRSTIGSVMNPNPTTRREKKTKSRASGVSYGISPTCSPLLLDLGLGRGKGRTWCGSGRSYGGARSSIPSTATPLVKVIPGVIHLPSYALRRCSGGREEEELHSSGEGSHGRMR